MRPADHRRGLLAVLIAAVLWSSGGLLIKWVSVDALVITMWRSLFAGLTIALVARRSGTGVSSGRRGLLIGVAASYALLLLLFVAATRLTTAANAIFLQYTAPIHVVLLGLVLHRERPSRVDLATLMAAFGGMALFFVGQLSADSGLGNLLALASGVAFGTFLVLLRHPDADARLRLDAMVWGHVALCLGIAGSLMFIGRWEAFTPSLRDLSALAFLGVVQIGVAYLIFAYGIARVRALEASLLGMLEPVLNPVWVWLVLGETPGRWAVVGGGLILSALALRTWWTERNLALERSAAGRAAPERATS